MAERSKIEWTDSSWTPIRARKKDDFDPSARDPERLGWHCEHVSEGCRNCYAKTINRRLGTGLDFKPGHRDGVEIFLDEKMLLAPLRWKKPRRIFVCSMTDLFADFVKDEWIDEIFQVMLQTEHRFQILTKRPQRMREWVTRFLYPGLLPTILENIWLGVSCEDQATAEARIPYLLATPAAVRFISVEPLLGRINLTRMRLGGGWYDVLGGWRDVKERFPGFDEVIDWVIVGGESGPHARPMDVAWARNIVAQCKAAGVACFVKQLGAQPFSGAKDDVFNLWEIGAGSYERGPFWANLRSGKGDDPGEWPADLRVREMPNVTPEIAAQ